MSYQALYRKFRPKDFDEVYGQEHIVTTLKNQFKSGRIGHAYVFSGTRGTGKTSIAKIFAKALNCENSTDGNPCGVCASCKKINDGASFNVFEVDGASNNGVDNVRTIIEDLSYPPVEGKYKVYIIDEAHMITQQAFNALLKTIEEPPSYAVFILATTEANRIPITILSRCQRYDFHRITIDMISKRIEDLCREEGFMLEERAIRYVARLADGSLRDALSMLDQCVSYYYGQEITFDMTLKMLGAANNDTYSALFRALCNYDVTSVLRITDEAIIKGMEPDTFVSDFTWYLRNLLLVKNGDTLEEVADISSEDAKAFMEEVEIGDNAQIIRYITLLSELLANLKFAPVKRITLEIGLIRLCRPQMDTDYDSLLARIDMLEKGMVNIPRNNPVDNTPASPVKKKVEPEPALDEGPPWESDFEKAEMADMEDSLASAVESESGYDQTVPAKGDGLAAAWPQLILGLSALERSSAAKAIIVERAKDSALVCFAKKDYGARYYSKPENVKKLSDAIDSFLGYHIEIEVKSVEEDEIPKLTEKNGGQTPVGMDSDEFLKNAELKGVKIEIED